MISKYTRLINQRKAVKSICPNAVEVKYLHVDIEQCQPELDIYNLDESYTISIPHNGPVFIRSKQFNGLLYALETFSQLITYADKNFFFTGKINDRPRFKHRGLMLDTSRHFLPVEIIKLHLNAMSINKMNVFHWHIVDDQSFPYRGFSMPYISEQHSFDPVESVYYPSDIEDVKDYANSLGINVIFELDNPGHTKSWGKEVLTKCEFGDSVFEGLDPSNVLTWNRLHAIFKEFYQNDMLKPYVHIGFDEVNTTCWQSNKEVNQFMEKLQIGGNYNKLVEYMMKREVEMISALQNNSRIILWDDILDSTFEIPPNVIIQIWRNQAGIVHDKLLKLQTPVIYSSCYYLNYINYGSDWKNMYMCSLETDLNLIGGEACVWAEYIDDSNSIQTTWPRASAVAERLWSFTSEENINFDEVSKRIDQMRCLLKSRGINAQPVNENTSC
ncbi:hypothetical protein GJ496_006516 [Pomphorhynchus laevis]|nr:hypothetical protein GJ496_006516 [Pomphorhynchus laevis]